MKPYGPLYRHHVEMCKQQHKINSVVDYNEALKCMTKKGYILRSIGGKRKRSRKRRPKPKEIILHDMVFLGGLDQYQLRYVKRNTRRSYR